MILLTRAGRLDPELIAMMIYSTIFMMSVTLKCFLQAGHLVEDTAHGPDVGLLVVDFPFTHLRTDVVGRSKDSVRPTLACCHHLGDAKVPNLHHVLLCQEYVGSLQVPVDKNHTSMKGIFKGGEPPTCGAHCSRACA